MKKRLLLAFCLALTAGALRAQETKGDPLAQGLWWLYHLQYDKAHAMFSQYVESHPDDPKGHFYQTATDWWRLAQEFDYSLPDVEASMENHYQKTVATAKTLYESTDDKKVKATACLYWGGAEGLKGRWLVTQKQWVKAYFLGKRGNNLLKRALDYDPTLYDAYMGLGIYDYFTDTLSGVQAVLSALLIHGDKARGLKELHWAIEKGEHARVEAMIFLIEIYTSEEDTPEKALPLTRQLRKEYPLSPAMHLAEVMTLYTMKDWDAMGPEAKSFLEKSLNETPWYSHKGVRPARYCLGIRELWDKRNPNACLTYMNQILDDGIDSSRWVSFAFLRRGQVYDLQGKRDDATKDYQTVLSRKDFWGSHSEAKKYLKKPFTY